MENLAAVSKGEHSKKTGLEEEACSLQKNDKNKPARMLNLHYFTYSSDLLWI